MDLEKKDKVHARVDHVVVILFCRKLKSFKVRFGF